MRVQIINSMSRANLTSYNERTKQQTFMSAGNLAADTFKLNKNVRIVDSVKEALNHFVVENGEIPCVFVHGKFKNSEYEKFYSIFDPVEHVDRIYADCFDCKNILHHTTIYDSNGLKLSQIYERLTDKKNAISKRTKIFDVKDRIVHEDIVYKNGDLGEMDYDYITGTHKYLTKHPDGSKDIVTSSKHYSESVRINSNGEIVYQNKIEF